MVRLLVLCMVSLGLFLGLTMARPMPAEGEVSALELGGRGLQEVVSNAPASTASPDREELGVAGGPKGALRGTRNHRPSDKSMAGAEVILGGLATAIFLVIFAYIRVTRKSSSDAKVSDGLALVYTAHSA